MSTAFRVTLTGNQQVPPVATSASGVGTVVFSDVAVAAAYSIRVNGLDFGPATGKPSQTPSTADDVGGIHVHNAPRGANGAIVFGQIDPAQDNDDLKVVLNADNSWTVSGNWELSDPAGTSISAFAAQLNATPIGADAPLYFNIHTSPFPSGIIRGQWVAIANDAGNTVVGTAGADSLPGLGGNDILLGLGGADTLDGGTGNDRLSGGTGNDRLLGGLGNDRLNGASGNDTLSGSFGNDRLNGESGNDVLSGGAGNDRMDGGSGNDVLSGGTGNDQMDGRSGNDRLSGSLGNDRLNGGAGDDRLNGGRGNDVLIGNIGNDVLIGGAGRDAFSFRTAIGGDVDTVADFSHGVDLVQLDDAVFSGLATGALAATAFHFGPSATTATERIIYDNTTGALFFDADGNGAITQVQFATLSGTPQNITNADFFVI